MHELSIATELVEQAQRVLREQKADRVVSIALALGLLSGIDREALEFAFPLAAADTPVAGATLSIEAVPARLFCPSCRRELSTDVPALICPACGNGQVELRGGRELLIKSMEVEGR